MRNAVVWSEIAVADLKRANWKRCATRSARTAWVAELEALSRRYPDQAGRRLADFLRAMQAS